MPVGYKRKGNYRGAPRKKMRWTKAGTTLPKSDKILDRQVDQKAKNQTMYGPSQNLRSTLSTKRGLMQNVGPFGARWAGKLKYVDKFNTSTVSGIYNEQLFNLNSLFDPDRTGVGHQPLGFDQLNVIYQRYRVLKTSYRLTMVNSDQTGSIALVTAVNNSTASLASVAYALEEGYSSFRIRNAFADPNIISATVVLNSLTGNSLIAYRSDDAYAALVTASPTELMILHIGLEGTTALSASVQYYIEMEFDCEFWDPLQLAQS